MISSSELRIGNKLQAPAGHIVTVKGIDNKYAYCHDEYGHENWMAFKDSDWSILLTEEWLLKFDFVYSTDWDIVIRHSGNKILFLSITPPMSKSDLGNYNVSLTWDYTGRWFKGDLKYVHQLQNLYFAITGLELEFKTP